MSTLRVTNWLLLGIFLMLLAHLVLRDGSSAVLAANELPRLPQARTEYCVTDHPNEKPLSYLHVVTHPFTGADN